MATSGGNGCWRATRINTEKKEGNHRRLVVVGKQREGEDTTEWENNKDNQGAETTKKEGRECEK